ncbi:MAG: peroxiredoxin family protein [Fimbriimonadales bacterium]
MKHFRLCGLAATVAAVAVACAAGLADAPKPGTVAPGITGNTADGKVVSLKEELKKGPVLVYFIGTTCPVSRIATPQYTKYARAYRAQGIKVIGVVNSGKDGFLKWNEAHAAPYPVVLDPGYKVIKAYGVEKAPSSALIGKDGKVIKFWSGFSRGFLEETSAASAKALGKAPIKIDFKGAPANWMAG